MKLVLLSSDLLAGTTATVVPCAILLLCAATVRFFELKAPHDFSTGQLRQASVFWRTLLLGLVIDLFALLPIPLPLVIVAGTSLAMLISMYWVWRATAPFAAVFTTISGLMLGAFTGEAALLLWSSVFAGTKGSDLLFEIVGLWVALATPVLLLALVAAGMKKMADHECHYPLAR